MPVRQRSEKELAEIKAKKLSSELSWELDFLDPMIINIFHGEGDNEVIVMRIFLGEAIDCAGREPIMTHLNEIESSPWLANWHKVENNNGLGR